MTKSRVYGLGNLLAASRDALLARTIRSTGSVSAAAPNAENFSTSRRDTCASIMTYPLTRRGSSPAVERNFRRKRARRADARGGNENTKCGGSGSNRCLIRTGFARLTQDDV